MINVKNVVLPADLESIPIKNIHKQIEGLLIVNRNNNPIGYIVYNGEYKLWYYNKTITGNSASLNRIKLMGLISLINCSEGITFSYIEFKK